MKRIRLALCAALVLTMSASMLFACGGGSTDSASSADRTQLVVGFDQNFPPYGYVDDNGDFAGFDLDLAKEVCDRLGWEVVYKPINWDAKDLEMDSGAIDCIWNGFTMEGRESDYEFTEPYMDNSQVIVVRKDSGITSLEGLSAKTVMAQADSAAMKLLQADGEQVTLAQTFKTLQSVADYNSAFLELESGAVDAVAMDLPVAKFQIAGKEDMFLILEDDPLSTEHYAVGFKLGNTELRDQVQAALKEMVADGTAEEICNKYADDGLDFQSWCLQA